MAKQDIDKLKLTLEDIICIYKDVEKTLKKGGLNVFIILTMVFKHGRKIVRLIKNLGEIREEIKDLDKKEVKELIETVCAGLESPKKTTTAIQQIIDGSFTLGTGIQTLILSYR